MHLRVTKTESTRFVQTSAERRALEQEAAIERESLSQFLRTALSERIERLSGRVCQR